MVSQLCLFSFNLMWKCACVLVQTWSLFLLYTVGHVLFLSLVDRHLVSVFLLGAVSL